MLSANPYVIFKEFPDISLGDIILRQITYHDAEQYLKYVSDPDVHRYIPSECLPQNLEQAKAEIDYQRNLFAYKRCFYWAIAISETNELIGSCGFNYWNRDHNRGEISYDLAKPYWGQGITTRACHAILTFGFETMLLKRIEATATPANHASVAVLKKLGFQQEGVLRQQKLLHGQYHDAIIFSILAHEFKSF